MLAGRLISRPLGIRYRESFGPRKVWLKMAEHYMVYWKTFWDDIDSPLQVKCDWYTNKRDFFEGLRRGDSLWVVTSGEESHGDEWRLLQRLFVENPLPHEPGHGNLGRIPVGLERIGLGGLVRQ